MYLKRINLKNKYALVTGAGKGLGRACSIALAEAGATIIGLSRTSSDLDKLEKDIKKVKSKLIKINCDVMNYSELQEKLKKIKIIDILVNNAGTNIPEPFEKIKQQSMNYLVDLNLKAAFNVAQLVVKKMIKNKKRGGSIINMSSQLGHVGMSGRNIYNMTKFGIEGLTKGMGVELATKNIRVNTVAPTFVETPMVKKFFKNKKFKNLALGNIPMGKAAKESDVATAVCFLASDAKKATVVATSSSFAALPIGIFPSANFLNFLFLKNLFTIGVSTKVGATVFTLIFFAASSTPIPLVNPSIPNLVIL